MKRLIVVILILMLTLPAVVSADEQDPIIGCWYICIDANDAPQNLIDEGYIYSSMIFVFTPGGQILYQNIDFKESSGTSSDVTYIGKWNKKDNDYIVSIISVGENKALLSDNILAACIFNSKQYIVLRKMTSLNMYNDIYNVK